MCTMNCLHCSQVDCTNNKITDAERKQQDSYDREVAKEHIPEERRSHCKYKLAQYDYNHSDKGRASRKRYERSEKGKASQKRYVQSEKGKATAKRKQQKQIASGKNAEYCRRYYQRKKAEREAQPC